MGYVVYVYEADERAGAAGGEADVSNAIRPAYGAKSPISKINLSVVAQAAFCTILSRILR